MRLTHDRERTTWELDARNEREELRAPASRSLEARRARSVPRSIMLHIVDTPNQKSVRPGAAMGGASAFGPSLK